MQHERMCNYCGKMFNYRGISLHIKNCISKLESIFGYSYCRFCDEECCDDIVFHHEAECKNKKEFSPYNYEDRLKYYEGLLSYDPNNKTSVSSCRHCNRSFLSTNIFKHEEGCLKQYDKFIGPLPEKRKCNYCLRSFYYTHNEFPIYYNGKPVIKTYKLYSDHVKECKEKSDNLINQLEKEGKMDTKNRRVLGAKIKFAKNLANNINTVSTSV